MPGTSAVTQTEVGGWRWIFARAWMMKNEPSCWPEAVLMRTAVPEEDEYSAYIIIKRRPRTNDEEEFTWLFRCRFRLVFHPSVSPRRHLRRPTTTNTRPLSYSHSFTDKEHSWNLINIVWETKNKQRNRLKVNWLTNS